jgi:hypothetical protein
MSIDAPGAVFTQATALNDRGEIAGTYRLPADSVLDAPIVGRYDIAAQGARGYLLAQADQSQSDEAYTSLHFPNAASSAALGINRKGAIVGGYAKADGIAGALLSLGDSVPKRTR